MSTYLGLHYHIIFGTKHRRPLLDAAIRSRVHEYLGGTVVGLGGLSLRVGGVADHVHLLVTLKATHCLADFMRELKKSSSTWIREVGRVSDFHWQEGYAALTVSPSARKSVADYIRNQEEHHRRRSFREELVRLIEKAGIEYDPRYLDDDSTEHIG